MRFSGEKWVQRSLILVSFSAIGGLLLIALFILKEGLPFIFDVGVKNFLLAGKWDPQAGLFLNRYKDFFRLAVLWYMTSAKDIPATGRLIRPLDVKGGQRFFSGTHVLPLDRIEERFGKDKVAFIERGLKFGAEIARYGDAAVRLYPLPRVPVTVILWLQDEEYPSRVTLFFDSTVDFQLSLSDIVWSVSMMSTLVMGE